MSVKSTHSTQNIEVTVTFSVRELEQLESVASLHDLYVPEFIHRAALEAAHLAPASVTRKPQEDTSWLTDNFQSEVATQPVSATNISSTIGQIYSKAPKVESKPAPAKVVTPTAEEEEPTSTSGTAKRGVVGEQSSLAKGSGPVWDIRQALGQERLHGLGWTREHLAYVLKLSVVGVRKLEHEGKSPVKSAVAREQLLGLAKALKEPTSEILEYIEKEEAALKLKAKSK